MIFINAIDLEYQPSTHGKFGFYVLIIKSRNINTL